VSLQRPCSTWAHSPSCSASALMMHVIGLKPAVLGCRSSKALTNLKLSNVTDIPASVTQLTALQQLVVSDATIATAARLQALTGLTQLRLCEMTGVLPDSATLQMPGLRCLELGGSGRVGLITMSFLCSCTQLQVLRLWGFTLRRPGSLVASTMLQQLELKSCSHC